LVDNWSSGGIIARVDVATGLLEEATDGTPLMRRFPEHPETGVRLEGVQLPCWEEVVALSERCVGLFPEMRFAGLDVGVSAEGPVIIELNPAPDKMNAAWMRLPDGRVLRP
jgi:hypothetical protein